MARIKRAIFKFKPFSNKQLKILTWWLPNSPVHDKDGIIADGAIRSGKTVSMALSFIMWAMDTFGEENFAMCGKTIGSFRRNVLTVLKLMLWSRGYKWKDHRADNLLEVTRKGATNYFYIFGGKDERSQDLIQGITLAGVFFDEVALMPESFVNQATGRCSVEGSKFWFNCNPSNPSHWFKKEWIDKAKEKALVYLHFTMDDNLSLSEKIKERYRSMYTGVFFKRFILGLWVAAEGVIYGQFADKPEAYTLKFKDDAEKKKYCSDIEFITIGIDFGGNRSLTTFVASAFHRRFTKVTALKDHNIKGKKGDIDSDKVNQEFISFYQILQKEYPNIPIRYCFADSEAQYLINGLVKACRKAGINIQIGDSSKNEIVQRIYCGNTLLNTGRMIIHEDCTRLSAGLQGAVWDAKAAEQGKDVRLDNFSSDIDILDAWEYSWERFMKKLLPEGVRN
ncbi:PBSX family phage terminase large subunit [Anaerovorax sp. IOR16]|uniref:PBSX family phage terminase large subunit n=1 Tax=Anaerovorax sp. IOR16 TaxID=2773458 RepID=UPI0019D16F13|nr:PBSX family phage terminase large subunit [Anaerovorax sp. IOR16]